MQGCRARLASAGHNANSGSLAKAHTLATIVYCLSQASHHVISKCTAAKYPANIMSTWNLRV